MKHTPTPWKTEKNKDAYAGGTGILPRKHSGHYVGVMFRSNPNEANDAEFIVRACNAHEELLEATKNAVVFLEASMVTKPTDDVSMALSHLRAAIAKAEGQS